MCRRRLTLYNNRKMILGAICGDIIGSVYERCNVLSMDFPLFKKLFTRFTDDTVLTVATMDCQLGKTKNYTLYYQTYGKHYRGRGYGSLFVKWMFSDEPQPYNSFGNGSAMRVSPIGWMYDSLEKTLAEAQRSAGVTHNHPEGIKGAQAIAACVFLARTGKKKEEIKEYVSSTFGYDLGRTIEEIRPSYHIGANATCQGSVPEAIISFLDSTDYENAIRLAISIGGDSDTIACMAGGIAEAYYREIPDEIVNTVLDMLPQQMKEVIEEFSAKYYS